MDEKSYLLRKLEESSGYYTQSFSNRYTNWKKNFVIRNIFCQTLRKKPEHQLINVLDAGCGEGSFIYKLKTEFSKNYNLAFHGIDLSFLDIDFAGKRKEYFGHDGCEFQRMDILNLDYEDNYFDIIITSEVIEHILEPAKMLLELKRVLKKDGFLIITTPSKGGSIFVRILRIIQRVLKRPMRNSAKECVLNGIDENEAPKIRLSSEGGRTGAGLGHVSVKSKGEWVKVFAQEGFEIILVKGSAGIIYGCPPVDQHRIIFALSVIFDTIFEKLPYSWLWSEGLLFCLKKAR
jgi:ubiquinone/menaquinone biosynthesis C-methylase UbiE